MVAAIENWSECEFGHERQNLDLCIWCVLLQLDIVQVEMRTYCDVMIWRGEVKRVSWAGIAMLNGSLNFITINFLLLI